MDMPQYIRRLATQLIEAYASPGQIHLTLQLEAVSVPIDAAIPCGLVFTELITDALQRAFPGGRPGEVSVTWRADAEDHVLLMVQDTGVGMPPQVDFAETRSLGTSLVSALTEQLGGSLRVEREEGTTVAVRFPARPER
jgi:two-component sensor histidine kinase